MDIHTPMITQGWNQLRSFYGDQSDKLVVFKYVGNSSFVIHVSKRSANTGIKTKFLNNVAIRRPLSMSNLIHFTVELSTYYCQASDLYLKKEFATYFQNSGLSSVVLHGPRGKVECKLIIRRRSVKIGSGWKDFCALHQLSVQDHPELFFEVESQRTSRDIKVLYPLFWF
ncbi:uncharacterized protein LOC114168294 [Vigna unguiculata]|uniref:uncharacterized protein LOC114168294 n=1 Tax=Vigna unguiculata TaxID=3917 RepID=UPI001015D22A|nr:uncharacterized protein LOC114168294 [Vigna unguiculata]